MNPILIGLFVYVAIQLLIGIAVSKQIKNEDDYLLAGRSLGTGLATLSVFATWFGAETCIGASGAVYEGGLSGATFDPFGYSLCLVLMGLLFSIPLWRRHLTTLADLFKQRYSGNIERLAVLLMIPGTVMWAAAQIRAFGQVLSATGGFQVEPAISCAAAVVIIYTLYGGLLADVITDAVQGVALIVGLMILLVMVVEAGGGWHSSASKIDPARLQFMSGNADHSWLDTVEQWAIPVCGSLMSQELVSRVLASRSPQIARRACVGGGLLYLLAGLIPVATGLIGYGLLPDLTQPEQILPRLAQTYLHAFLYVIFTGALISAILSTVDSALLAASALISHNLIVPVLGLVDQRRKLLIARTAVMMCGLIAYVLALHAGRVYSLVEEASAFGSAGVITVVVFGLFTRFGGSLSAAAALISGLLAWIGGSYWLELRTPYLWSLGAAIFSYVLMACVEARVNRYKNTGLPSLRHS